MRAVLALVMVCLIGVMAIYWQTDGFTVVTTEAARRAAIERQPRPLPDVALWLQSDRNDKLLHNLKSDGRVVVVNFMYTGCMSVCLALGAEFQRLQKAIQEQALSHQVRLLSISFDPADTPATLARYARQMRSDPAIWQFASVPDPQQRRKLLDAFGIIVVPAPLGQFEHNAAYHIVMADGRLAHIIDYDNPQDILQVAAVQRRPQ
ncbi:MAG TPA: SCO family protein [Eoetvoesiella sp.]